MARAPGHEALCSIVSEILAEHRRHVATLDALLLRLRPFATEHAYHQDPDPMEVIEGLAPQAPRDAEAPTS